MHILYKCVKSFKFPDGHTSNIGMCIDMQKYKLFGIKSHNCHVLMHRLLPIVFCELLPLIIWQELTELILFFRHLTSTNIKIQDMECLELEILFIN